MMDLLAAIHSGELSEEEAEKIFNSFWEQDDLDVDEDETWPHYFGFSGYEATAKAHGASLSVLVQYRYEGWPTTCSRCGKPLDYTQYHWLFTRDENYEPSLEHITCPGP
jgi:hypothetical protein